MSAKSMLEFIYPMARAVVFPLTSRDPELAHKLFAAWGGVVSRLGLASSADMAADKDASGISISPAAGFNKNADFPPDFLASIGFDRNVVGTVTQRSWLGNTKPRCRRFPATGSMINFLGLPNLGAEAIRLKLESQRGHLPTTLNLTATPDPAYTPDQRLDDIMSVFSAFHDFQPIDRIELNISCPNTGEEERERMLNEAARTVAEINSRKKAQKLYLKVSPDMDDTAIVQLVQMYSGQAVDGFVLCNTTTERKPEFIPESWNRGGVSGEGVYMKSSIVRRRFLELGVPASAIVACGGISSPERAETELAAGIREFQLYTPFIFQGPTLLRRIRQTALQHKTSG